MNGYLKCYYGYKNLGDELLIFGVIDYVFSHYSLSKLFIEAGDVDRLTNWLAVNKEFIGENFDKIVIVPKGKIIYADYYFLGGGEVIDDSRPFPHNGRNYLFIFFRAFLTGKVILLGGVSKAKTFLSRIMQAFLLSRAQKIVLRDPDSLKYCYKFNKNVVLYEDFAYFVLRKRAKNVNKKNLIIILTGKEINTPKWEKIASFIKESIASNYYYLPCDLSQDTDLFLECKKKYPTLKLYDRTQNSLSQTLELFANAESGISDRLHGLLILNYFDAKLLATNKTEKVQKFLRLHANE